MSKMLKMNQCSVIFLAAIIVLVSNICIAAEPNATKGQAMAEKMNKLLGRGVNFGNALDAPSEGEWGVTLKDEYFDLAKQAGFNSIRLPVRWSAHAMTEKPYTIDPNFMKRVDWAVNNAISRNVPVILNIHHYRESYTDPNGHKERYIALWKQIAEHYKGYPEILLFELMNEPKDKLDSNMWNIYMKESLALVRQSNHDRTIIIGPSHDNVIEYLKDLDIPKDDRNIIVTIHYYSPLPFTHQGADWITKGDPNTWMGTKWTGTDAEKKPVTKAFDIAAAWAKANNRPMNLGEFGSYKKADMDSRARWTKFVADTAIERGMSFHYWEFCASEFGLYDQQTKSFRKPLLEAVLPPAVSLPALNKVEGPNPPK